MSKKTPLDTLRAKRDAAAKALSAAQEAAKAKPDDAAALDALHKAQAASAAATDELTDALEAEMTKVTSAAKPAETKKKTATPRIVRIVGTVELDRDGQPQRFAPGKERELAKVIDDEELDHLVRLQRVVLEGTEEAEDLGGWDDEDGGAD